MTTGATGQLGLALPVQGELSGTWGDTVNNGITQYTNIAIAGTLTLTGDGAVTLANTTGDASASNITSTLAGAGTVTAQFAIVRVTGTLTVAKVVTAPSYSKTYTVVNAATGGIVTFKASGQTGVSVAVGESAFVYFNGTDYVKLAGTVAVASFQTSLSGLTPSTATTGAVTLAGTLGVASGGTGLTAGTSGGILGYTATGTLASSVALTANALVLGAGAGATPTPMASLGTTTTVLHGNASGAPTFGAVSLTADVTGVLPTANGGTNLTSFTSGGVVYASSTSALATGSGLIFNGTNLGLGVTPSAWSGAYSSALQVGRAVMHTNSGDFRASFGQNYYVDGTNAIYIGTGFSTQLMQVNGQFRFFTAPSGTAGNAITFTQAMTLDASGNLGVGTTSPQAKLQVLDQIKVSSADQSSGIVALGDGSSTSVNVGIGRWNGSTNVAGTGGMGYFSQGAVNSGGHYFYTGDAAAGSQTERARIPAAGGFQSKTTISVGDATPSSSGAGITFPATQSASSNANTLDDYEEGTWTPTLAWSTPGTSVITPTSSSGQYTKVGNMAYCAFNFDNATFTNGTASGYLILSGLPFTSSSSATAIWGGSITTNIGFPTNLQNTLVDTGATTATFKKSDGSASNVVVADVSGAGKYIRVAFMYRTA